MKIFYRLLPIISVLFLTIFFSCNTTEPPPPNNGTLSISLTDASCTEAWVELKTNGVAFPVNVNILADGGTVTQLNNLNRSDTTVYIDSLLPNKTYNIQAIIPSTNQFQTTSSNKLTVQTLDTTSNNFTWQTYTFGASNAGSSTLYDVAVIDANNIWAVGEIYMDDSTGRADPTPYNAVHWDGNNWELKRIKTNACGGVVYPPIISIFAFSADDILFAHIDGSISYYNGIEFTNDCSLITQLNGSVNKIWGKSKNDFYVVSSNGFIAHYNGSSWQKIESGTTTDIDDIWGASDSLVLATVSSRHYQGDNKLLSITPTSATEYTSWPYQKLYGIWFNSDREIYVVSNSAYLYKNNTWSTISLPTNYFLTGIRGNGSNDVFIAGTSGIIFHFDGVDWQNLNQIGADYERLDTKGNTVVAIGFNTVGSVIADAVITIGKR